MSSTPGPFERTTVSPLDFNYHVQDTLGKIMSASGSGDRIGVINLVRNLKAEMDSLEDEQYLKDLEKFNDELDADVSSYSGDYKRRGQLTSKVERAIHEKVYGDKIYDLHTILMKLAIRKGLIQIDATYVQWDLKDELKSVLKNNACPSCKKMFEEVIERQANPFRTQD